MIIATGSLNIDENAKLANDNNEKIKDSARGFKSLMSGKVTTSSKTPEEAQDTNEHQDGDLWIQLDDEDNAKTMFTYSNGGWQENHWSQQALSVKNLAALSADLGHVKSGVIDAVTINGAEINVDMNGVNGYARDNGHNKTAWDSPLVRKGGDDNEYLGFHFANGLMSFKGRRLDYYSLSPTGSYDATYITPNKVKLRETADAEASNIISRLDITSDSIVMGTNWYDSQGVKINLDGGGNIDTAGASFNSLTLRNTGYSSGFHNYGDTNLDGRLSINRVSYDGDPDLTVWGYTQLYRWLNSTAGITCQRSVQASNIDKHSSASIKRDIEEYDTKKSLSNILGTKLYSYKYINDISNSNIGPIIDDQNSLNSKKYSIPNELTEDPTSDEDVMSWSITKTVASLVGAVQELEKQKNDLLYRVMKLEMGKEIGNNK